VYAIECRATPRVVLVCCVSDCTVDAEHMCSSCLFRGVHTHDRCCEVCLLVY